MINFESYLQAVGRAIKHQRVLRNLTQQQLITKVHELDRNEPRERQLAQETLSRIENGRLNPSLRQLYLVSLALEVSLSDLFLSIQKEDA